MMSRKMRLKNRGFTCEVSGDAKTVRDMEAGWSYVGRPESAGRVLWDEWCACKSLDELFRTIGTWGGRWSLYGAKDGNGVHLVFWVSCLEGWAPEQVWAEGDSVSEAVSDAACRLEMWFLHGEHP